MFYDALIVLALLMVGTAALLPLTGGEAVDARGNLWYQLYLLAIVVGFFTGFWARGGQTLGMRAWRLKLERENGEAVRWRDGLLRLCACLLSWLPAGLGFLWAAVDDGGRTWHGRLSHTRIVLIES
jgi:uncharacterized RDD family membrane protein YckC